MSQDGRYLAAGDRNGAIYFIETTLTDLPVRQYTIPGGVLALSVSGSGMVSATAGSGGLYFFGKASSQFSYNWTFGVGTSFPELAMTKGAGHIVTGTNNGSVYFMDGSGQLIDRQTVKGAVSALSISEMKDRVLVGSASGNVTLYSMRDRLEKLESLEASGAVTSAIISENAERISVAQLDGGISMFNRSLATHMWTFDAGGIVHSLSISQSGQVTAAASDTGDIYVFDEGGSQRVTETMSSGVLVAAVIALVVASVIWARRRRSNESGSREPA
jgi:WD40 repeat protein